MNKRTYYLAAVAFVLTAFSVGCSRNGASVEFPQVSRTNDLRVVLSQPPIDPKLQMRLDKMREALDAEQNSDAMAIGRELLIVSDVRVKMQVIDAFGWIGRLAIPELTECMNHPDERIAHSAFTAWEMAISQHTTESGRIVAIIESVKKVNDAALVEQMLLQLSTCDETRTIQALDSLVVSSRGLVCNVCAKNMFEHLTGETWSSTNRTKVLLTSRERKL